MKPGQFLRYLSVALATVRTNVCLDVLRFFVLGNMFQESSFISETFVATLTFVWFVRLMTSTVGLKVGELGEGLGATCNSKSNVRRERERVNKKHWWFLPWWVILTMNWIAEEEQGTNEIIFHKKYERVNLGQETILVVLFDTGLQLVAIIARKLSSGS